jgi:hypothetical protein
VLETKSAVAKLNVTKEHTIKICGVTLYFPKVEDLIST